MGWAVDDGIARNYKRLRTQGLSPQQLLVAFTPTLASLLTMSSTHTCLNPWTAAHNDQWDKWQSPIVGHGSIHRRLQIQTVNHAFGWLPPTPHVVRERATACRARDDNFSDASHRDRMWAFAIGLDVKMDIFKTCPQEYADVQLHQWLVDGLYDLKDQPFMNESERLSQRYTATGVGMVYGHVVDLQHKVTRTRLFEDTITGGKGVLNQQVH